MQSMRIDLYNEVYVDFPVYRQTKNELQIVTETCREVFVNLKADLKAELFVNET